MRRKYQEFDLEHSIMESAAKHYEPLELPLSRGVFVFFAVVTLLIGGIVLARILFLNFIRGDFYKTRSSMNVEQPITIPASRGNIYDRYGKILAGSEASHRVVLNVGLVKREKVDLSRTLDILSGILWVDKSELESLVQKADLEKNALITLARNITAEQADLIRSLDSKVVEIQNDYQREYLMGPAFSHVLGYTGLVEFNDEKGKVGLEEYYDNFVGGKDGVRLIYRDARAEILDEKLLEAPKNGNYLYTTIDAGFQEYFYNRLQQALRTLGRNAAVGIALNPQNGEILSFVSLPSYDNNIFSDIKLRKMRGPLLSAPFEPLFNRAIAGVYAPGSTIKPMVAVAALKEEIVKPESRVFSSGVLEIPNPYFPDQPSRFLDWKAQGWVDLHSALARSSNIYFYAVGGGIPDEVQGLGDVKKGLGIEKLKEYWKLFGLGEKTGVDLNGENSGFLPDPQEKEAVKKDIWRLGDTYNVTIGQGDLLVTPVQLINYVSSIANGGKLYKPFLIKDIKDENGNMVLSRGPELLKDFSYLNGEIKEVQKGMEDAVNKWYGTAYSLADLSFSVAAKTGSAQVSNNTKTNAFFVGYAPADNPQIAVLVLIENAREGSLNAVPVGKDVLDWYYWNRIVKSP